MALFKKNNTDKEKEVQSQNNSVSISKNEKAPERPLSMAERHSVSKNKSDNEVVMPTFDADSKRKTLVKLTEEQSSYDSMNSLLIEDKVTEQLDVEEDNKEKKRELNKKLKPFKIVAACLAGAGVIAAAVVIILNMINKGTDISLKPIDGSEQSGSATSSTEENDKTSDDSGTTSDDSAEIINRNFEFSDSTMNNPMDVGKYYKKSVVVNVKETENSNYQNFDTEYYFGVTDISCGYDSVAKYVEEYNEKSNSDINIGNEDSITDNMSIAMFTVRFDFPEDFPSNLGDNKFRDIPEFKIRLIGNPILEEKEVAVEENFDEEELNYEKSGSNSENDFDSLFDETEIKELEFFDEVIENYVDYITYNSDEYEIHDLKPIFIQEKAVDTVNGVAYRYITTLPRGIDESNYIIELTVGDKILFYKGVEITN